MLIEHLRMGMVGGGQGAFIGDVHRLAARLDGKGVTAYSCHPGVIKSELMRYMMAEVDEELQQKSWLERTLSNVLSDMFQLAMMETADGALTQLHLATAKPSDLVNGGFYHPIGRFMGAGSHAQAENETLQQLLWTETDRMISQAGFGGIVSDQNQ